MRRLTKTTPYKQQRSISKASIDSLSLNPSPRFEEIITYPFTLDYLGMTKSLKFLILKEVGRVKTQKQILT
jgi:hypothetical protein